MRAPLPHALRADVDGDGSLDVVGLLARGAGPERCQSFLIVKTQRTTFARPLVAASEQPILVGAAPIDRRGGLEIVTELHRGASTDFATLFRVDRHRVLWIGRRFPDALSYNGGVTHLNAVDCGSPGTIVAMGAAPINSTGTRWAIGRDLWRLTGSRLRLERRTTRTISLRRGRLPGLPEPQPFPSCLEVRPR